MIINKINIVYCLVLIVIFFYYPIDIILSNLNLPIIHTYFFVIIISLLLTIYILVNLNRFLEIVKNIKFSFITFILIMLMIILYAITNNLAHVSDKNLILYIIYMYSYFTITIFIAIYFNQYIEKKSNSLLLYIFFSFLYYFLLFYSNDFDIVVSLIFGFNADGAIYLSSSIFIIVFSFYTMIKNKKYTLLLSINSFLLIITLGSRTAMLFFLISYLYFIIKTYSLNKLILLCITIVTILSFYFQDIFFLISENERLLSLVELNTSDSSITERLNQFNMNWKFIEDTYFTGLFMSEILVLGEGKYIHSYLSYLQSFGIIVFIFINILVIKLIYDFFVIKNKNEMTIFINTIFIYTLLEFLFSRSYLFTHLLFFLMFYEYYYTTQKKELAYAN